MSEEKREKTGGKKQLFKKGQVANPHGRPKGVPNKITTQTRELMLNFFMGNMDTMQSDFDAMEAKDKMNFRAKMFPYFMPTLTATKVEKTVNHTGFEHVSTDKLMQMMAVVKHTTDTEDIDHEETE